MELQRHHKFLFPNLNEFYKIYLNDQENKSHSTNK